MIRRFIDSNSTVHSCRERLGLVSADSAVLCVADPTARTETSRSRHARTGDEDWISLSRARSAEIAQLQRDRIGECDCDLEPD